MHTLGCRGLNSYCYFKKSLHYVCLCFRRATLSKHEHAGEDSAGSCHPRDHKQLELDLVCLIDFFNQKELRCCSSLDENLKPSRQTKQADTSTG